ncbi:attractin-like protein 1 [Aricia agestis]|uniref:attractin-like protein 1 n=1 Tax=Aricia agestis TaxID=91739 RepID=UPI001C209DBF|nr:attractin-like protein 1 [Aricia agestis]
MVEALQMFLFLFKSKYRRKCSWFSPFLCSVIIVLLFCNGVLSKCSELNCLNGVCKNDTCVCEEGWQGPECQHCGGKIKLTDPMGIITDGVGNYSVSTQCSWLISPPWLGPNAPSIRVRLESFATECGWDHLYVYDGDSVRAERLLAVFSGVMDSDGSTWTRQVVAHSGSVLMHFFSDDAYAMEGFNVTYAAYSCPSDEFHTNCSNHGECDEGICRCEPNWIGVACDKPLCPDDCNAQYGAGSCTSEGCVCTPSRSGENCGREVSVAGWKWAWHEAREGVDSLRPKNVPPATAGHVLLNYDDDLLRVGGECFGEAEFVYRYKSADHEWIAMESRGEVPAPRFAHAAIVFGHELIVYGGVVAADDPERGGGLAGVEGGGGAVSNEVWRGRLAGERLVWRNATPASCAPHTRCGGLHLSGHSAVLVYIGPAKKPVMLSFFGHSPHYGYLHLVQEYYIEEGVWSVAQTKGWPARAGFGHTAAYDDASNRVYIHAGLVSESEATQAPSDALYEYNVDSRVWRPLPRAPTPRYLHAAIFVSPGMMLVFGGNAHNDSAAAAPLATPAANKCYSGDAYLYDVRCARWLTTSSPLTAPRAASAVALLPKARTSTAIFIAGFDGRLRSDALLFETGSKCSTHKDETSCLNSAKRAAIACVWRIKEQMCESLAQVSWQDTFNADKFKSCSADPVFDGRRCAAAGYCEACVAAGCAWCGACLASARLCLRRPTQMALSVEECGGSETSAVCGRYHSCAACHAHLHRHPHGNDDSRACYWDYDSVKCRPANTTVDLRGVSGVSSVGLSSVGGPGAGACSAACSTYKTCANCTAEECIWCASAARCVDKNAYGASFPLGGCRAWSTSGCAGGGASAAVAGCSAHASCAACRAEPACGWCDDGAGGGRGACLPGGERRPHHPHVCPHRRWHFTRCPACQCNGHAVCDASARCVQPCGARAIGAHCEQCAPQHWGSPLNGGVCQPCECNAQAVACAADTGRCFCSTKGLAGDRCDKCDNTNHYHPDLYNKGCYYDLAVDYQFTFNLSKKEDRHLSAINFRNAPVKPDVDADFSITCSAHARMNLTVRTRTHPERTLFSDLNCTNFRYKFAKSEHAFGVEDNVTLTTFFVYVYDFRPPLWIQISFSQYPKLNLQQFFITFSSCFLLLLLVAAALWKIKQKYDLYRRRQRLFVEMEQMASRPFSQVSIELERSGSSVNGSVGGPPAPVALEPCAGGRAAVLSLVVRLPTGGTGRAPPLGGLALASALVTLGHHPPPRTHKRRAR